MNDTVHIDSICPNCGRDNVHLEDVTGWCRECSIRDRWTTGAKTSCVVCGNALYRRGATFCSRSPTCLAIAQRYRQRRRNAIEDPLESLIFSLYPQEGNGGGRPRKHHAR